MISSVRRSSSGKPRACVSAGSPNAYYLSTCTALDLTSSEFTLIGLLLRGHDLATAASYVGANYDTKRKQIRVVFNKALVKTQGALLGVQSRHLVDRV